MPAPSGSAAGNVNRKTLMSILAATNPPAPQTFGGLILWIALGLALAAALGVFRRSGLRDAGPLRDEGESAWKPAFVIFCGLAWAFLIGGIIGRLRGNAAPDLIVAASVYGVGFLAFVLAS